MSKIKLDQLEQGPESVTCQSGDSSLNTDHDDHQTPIWAETGGLLTDAICALILVLGVIGIIVDLPAVAAFIEPGSRQEIPLVATGKPDDCIDGVQTNIRFVVQDINIHQRIFDPSSTTQVSQGVEGIITQNYNIDPLFPETYINISDYATPRHQGSYSVPGGYQIGISKSLYLGSNPLLDASLYFTGDCGNITITITQHTDAYRETHRAMNIIFAIALMLYALQFGTLMTTERMIRVENLLIIGLFTVHLLHLIVSIVEVRLHSWERATIFGSSGDYPSFNSSITRSILMYYVLFMIFVAIMKDVLSKVACTVASALLLGLLTFAVVCNRTVFDVKVRETNSNNFDTYWFLCVAGLELVYEHEAAGIITGTLEIILFLTILKYGSNSRRYLHTPYFECRIHYLRHRIFLWTTLIVGIYFLMETVLSASNVYYPSQMMTMGKEIFYFGITICLSVLLKPASHPHTSAVRATKTEWKNISWPLSWRRWLQEHTGAASFYYFVTTESETNFWRRQLTLPCEDWQPRTPAFHFIEIFRVWTKVAFWVIAFACSSPALVLCYPFGGAGIQEWLILQARGNISVLHRIPPLSCTLVHNVAPILKYFLVQMLYLVFLASILFVQVCLIPVVLILSSISLQVVAKIPSKFCITFANLMLRLLYFSSASILDATPVLKDDREECLVVPTFCLETATTLAQVCYETYRSCTPYERSNPLGPNQTVIEADDVIIAEPNEQTSILRSGMMSANVVGRRGQLPPNRPIDFTRCGVELVCVVVANGMQVLIGKMPPTESESPNAAGNGSTYVISFRGTVNDENKKCDLDFLRIDWCESATVHGGFVRLWRSIEEEVMAALVVHCANAERFFVTGHSLGAAIATLCAHSVALSYGSFSVVLYTFGAPLMGDEAFKIEMNSRVPHHFNVRNENDACTLASGTPGNQHSGIPVHIGRCGQVLISPCYLEWVFMPWGSGNPISAHKLVRYLSSLAIAVVNLGVSIQVNIGDEDEVPAWALGPSAGSIPTGALVGVESGVARSGMVPGPSYSNDMLFGNLAGYQQNGKSARIRTLEHPYFVDVNVGHLVRVAGGIQRKVRNDAPFPENIPIITPQPNLSYGCPVVANVVEC
eukprot:TRINITY_DN815_c1_g1_i2.p1 TRINITY_DN815_c1_g1~~TRINITY_DN815_c1_g1_i2.p1  ORF type:complete len:1113 (+),score=137.02 TRINITY_DN815_c1_g1_i2:34-3372(+)